MIMYTMWPSGMGWVKISRKFIEKAIIAISTLTIITTILIIRTKMCRALLAVVGGLVYQLTIRELDGGIIGIHQYSYRQDHYNSISIIISLLLWYHFHLAPRNWLALHWWLLRIWKCIRILASWHPQLSAKYGPFHTQTKKKCFQEMTKFINNHKNTENIHSGLKHDHCHIMILLQDVCACCAFGWTWPYPGSAFWQQYRNHHLDKRWCGGALWSSSWY